MGRASAVTPDGKNGQKILEVKPSQDFKAIPSLLKATIVPRWPLPRIATSSPSIYEKRTSTVSRDLGIGIVLRLRNSNSLLTMCNMTRDRGPSLRGYEWLRTERAGRGRERPCDTSTSQVETRVGGQNILL